MCVCGIFKHFLSTNTVVVSVVRSENLFVGDKLIDQMLSVKLEQWEVRSGIEIRA